MPKRKRGIPRMGLAKGKAEVKSARSALTTLKKHRTEEERNAHASQRRVDAAGVAISKLEQAVGNAKARKSYVKGRKVGRVAGIASVTKRRKRKKK